MEMAAERVGGGAGLWLEVGRPVEGLKRKGRFHGLEIGIAVEQGDFMFDRHCRDQDVGSAWS